MSGRLRATEAHAAAESVLEGDCVSGQRHETARRRCEIERVFVPAIVVGMVSWSETESDREGKQNESAEKSSCQFQRRDGNESENEKQRGSIESEQGLVKAIGCEKYCDSRCDFGREICLSCVDVTSVAAVNAICTSAIEFVRVERPQAQRLCESGGSQHSRRGVEERGRRMRPPFETRRATPSSGRPHESARQSPMGRETRWEQTRQKSELRSATWKALVQHREEQL